MKTLWTETSAAQATSGKIQGTWTAARVEIDSRKVMAGDLFVALKGENFDGHDYVADALAKGASAAVVSHAPQGVDVNRLLVVPDVQNALDDLGRAGRTRAKARVVGVTGSVGKTSTKEMLRLVLSAHGETYATTGNYNNHIGTPLNLANLSPEFPFAVFEMGMNHAGEIAHLTKMVKPDVAVITNVEAVHSEFFPSVEGIAYAKSEIFEGVQAGGVAILNRDNPYYEIMQKQAAERGVKTIIRFGEHAQADCRLASYAPLALGCAVEAVVFDHTLRYTMQAVGKHWATTSLIALAVTHALGLDTEKTAKALTGFGELAGRGKLEVLHLPGGAITLIDDSYNASPAAMLAAFAKTIEVWEGKGRKGRKLAALGDMLELGAQAPQLHSGLAAELDGLGFDGVFTAGSMMQHLRDALPASRRAVHTPQAMDLLPVLLGQLKNDDILLVKGSHGSKMYELVSALRQHHPATTEKRHAV